MVDEFHTPVLFIFQFVEDIPVEDKYRQDGQSGLQRMEQPGIVVQAQVTSKPEYIDRILHDNIPLKQIIEEKVYTFEKSGMMMSWYSLPEILFCMPCFSAIPATH